MQHLLRSSSIRYNIRLVHEGIIKSVRLGRQECDVIVERLDGSSAYLAVRFNLPLATTDAEPRSLPWKKPMNPFITDDECGRESDQPHTTRETEREAVPRWADGTLVLLASSKPSKASGD
jgi:hypothetical protein